MTLMDKKTCNFKVDDARRRSNASRRHHKWR